MAVDNILYCSVVLSEESQNRLITRFQPLIPKDWKVIAHHMTIAFGSGLPDDLKKDLGETAYLSVEAVGISDKAMAVRVSGYPSNNEIPHITLAVNPDGGKPVMSNYIKDWYDLSKSLKLTGIVTEIPK